MDSGTSQDAPLRASDTIQGNILAGFRKDHQVFLFLQFGEANRAKSWLGAIKDRVATTRQVADFNRRFSEARDQRGGDDPENLKAKWVNVGLTFAGLQIIAPQRASELAAFATPTADNPSRQGFPAFTDGPLARAALLNDTDLSDPKHWDFGNDPSTPIHALLTVAADDPDDLIVEMEKQRALASHFGLVSVYEQRGATLPGDRAGHEHFGFKDGISQPGVMGFDAPDPDHPDQVKGHPGTDLIAPGEFILGYPRQPTGDAPQSVAPPTMDQYGNVVNPVPPPDPNAPRPCPDWMKDGSFQVFRRLRQDVPGFWSQATRLVQSDTFQDPPKEDVLAAKLMGRWRSGTPLALAPAEDNRSSRDPKDDNNFEFTHDDPGQTTDDTEGHRCPLFAHIRKMYPRANNAFGSERRRIIRRGIPFGLPFDPAGGRGHGVDADRGLLFMAFMSDIDEQFEFLQRTWANGSDFPEGQSGADPVIGTDPNNRNVLLKRQDTEDHPMEIERFVHTTGAVYAFTPSLPTLIALAGVTL